MNGPNAAYDEAIRALTNAQNQHSQQIAHGPRSPANSSKSGNALNLLRLSTA